MFKLAIIALIASALAASGFYPETYKQESPIHPYPKMYVTHIEDVSRIGALFRVVWYGYDVRQGNATERGYITFEKSVPELDKIRTYFAYEIQAGKELYDSLLNQESRQN